MTDLDSTEQFTNRVDNYVKYRPSYPKQVLDTLEGHCGLNAESVVADMGSGTGIFTKLLHDRGYKVFAVEPNDKMRAAAERDLSGNPQFHSIVAKAEETGLDDHSVDLITAAQAFHWFKQDDAKREFDRILRPGGWLALFWNVRTTGQPFQKAYEEFLRQHAPGYKKPEQEYKATKFGDEFFDVNSFQRLTFANKQRFDFEGLVGRLQSSSYAPASESSELRAELKSIHDEHAVDGEISLDYELRLYFGRLKRN